MMDFGSLRATPNVLTPQKLRTTFPKNDAPQRLSPPRNNAKK